MKKLTLYRGELVIWAEVIEGGVREGLDINGIWELLKEEDPILRLSLGDDDGRRRTAYPNIMGLMEYAKWKIREEAKQV